MSIYRQRDIALMPFPFSDLSAQKIRPVLVLSNDAYNQQSPDILVCGMTSNLRPLAYAIIVEVDDVEVPGTLRQPGKIKVDTIMSLEQSLLLRRIARLKAPLFEQVIAEIERLLSR